MNIELLYRILISIKYLLVIIALVTLLKSLIIKVVSSNKVISNDNYVSYISNVKIHECFTLKYILQTKRMLQKKPFTLYMRFLITALLVISFGHLLMDNFNQQVFLTSVSLGYIVFYFVFIVIRKLVKQILFILQLNRAKPSQEININYHSISIKILHNHEQPSLKTIYFEHIQKIYEYKQGYSIWYKINDLNECITILKSSLQNNQQITWLNEIFNSKIKSNFMSTKDTSRHRFNTYALISVLCALIIMLLSRSYFAALFMSIMGTVYGFKAFCSPYPRFKSAIGLASSIYFFFIFVEKISTYNTLINTI